MPAREFDPRRLDVAAFAAAGGELASEMSADDLPRLASATLPPANDLPRRPVRWRVAGARLPLEGAGVRPSILLAASTEVTLECQRCLQPMALALAPERRIFFVEGEDAAAALDPESEDDVLALTPSLDLPALIEDELLLALPLVPRHEICPEPLPRSLVADDAQAADHPFAALAALKHGPGRN